MIREKVAPNWVLKIENGMLSMSYQEYKILEGLRRSSSGEAHAIYDAFQGDRNLGEFYTLFSAMMHIETWGLTPIGGNPPDGARAFSESINDE